MEKTGSKKEGSFLLILKRFLHLNKKSIKNIVLVIVLIIINMILVAGINVWVGKLIDCIKDNNIYAFYSGVLILLGMQFIKMLSTYQVNFRASFLSETCIKTMRDYTYEHISKANMKWLDENKVGDIISRINNDLNTLVESISIFITWEISGFINLIISILACFILSFKLSLVTFALVPIIAILQVITGKPIAALGEKKSIAEGKSNALFVNLLGGLSIMKSFGIEKEMYHKYEKTVDQVIASNIKSFSLESAMYPLQMAMNFTPVIVLVVVGSYYVIEGSMTLGTMIAFLMVASNGLSVLGSLSWYIRDIYNTIGIAGRIFELWDVEKEMEGGACGHKLNDTPIVFQNVTFGYSEDQIILNGISFYIEKGEKVAIVGESGCGKSTILKIVAGFYMKNSGTIKIFGHEINEWNISELRKLIAYVGQDSFLFPESILHNVMRGRKDSTEEEAKQALEAVGLAHLDLQAPIGESGKLLSGGQRQRICIARALVKNADIILLDEPTASLDTEAEYIANKGIEQLTKGKTCVMIAHRLSAMRNVDRILYLQDEKASVSGTHEELMHLDKGYRALYEKQIKEVGDKLCAK